MNNPVLHCTELEKVFVKRNSDDITGIRPEYQELKKRKSEDIEKIYTRVYGKISQALRKSGATVFSCIIKIQQLLNICIRETPPAWTIPKATFYHHWEIPCKKSG